MELKSGVPTILIRNIRHVHNGRGSFEFTPKYYRDGSVVRYYLQIIKNSGDESKDFELPRVDPKLFMAVSIGTGDGSQFSLGLDSTIDLEIS